jgi:hypothetical protein
MRLEWIWGVEYIALEGSVKKSIQSLQQRCPKLDLPGAKRRCFCEKLTGTASDTDFPEPHP